MSHPPIHVQGEGPRLAGLGKVYTDEALFWPGSIRVTWLLPHREDGADCPRCGGTIRKARVSGRAAYFCDEHQAD